MWASRQGWTHWEEGKITLGWQVNVKSTFKNHFPSIKRVKKENQGTEAYEESVEKRWVIPLFAIIYTTLVYIYMTCLCLYRERLEISAHLVHQENMAYMYAFLFYIYVYHINSWFYFVHLLMLFFEREHLGHKDKMEIKVNQGLR